MGLEELGKIADGWISEGERAIDSFEKFATTELDKRFGKIGTQLRGFSESFSYDERDSISGEAKPLHPNMVAGLTPVRFIGVTRLPLLGAKVVQKVATWLTKTETKQIASKSAQTTKSIVSSLRGKSKMKAGKAVAVGTGAYMMSKARPLIRKITPKRAAMIGAGMIVTHLLTTPHGSHNSGEAEEWMMRPKKKRREAKWL